MKPIEWSAPSSRPHRSVTADATAATSSGLLTSICITSGGDGSLRATFSVRRTPLPTLVSRISAPCSCATLATANAMLSSVRTPVMSSFLPSRSMREGPPAADGPMRRAPRGESGIVPAPARQPFPTPWPMTSTGVSVPSGSMTTKCVEPMPSTRSSIRQPSGTSQPTPYCNEVRAVSGGGTG